MEGVPAGIGSWSVMRIFQEGGRLLNEHFGVFLPAILLFIFPASLIKVLFMQFLYALQFDSPDGESRSFLTLLFFDLVSLLAKFFLLYGVGVLFQVLTNAVYIADGKATPSRTELLRDSMKLALFRRDVEAGNPVLGTTTTKHPLYDWFRQTAKGKKLKACAVVVGSAMLYTVVSTGGLNFTPESVAEWGLPPATIFLFTALVTLLSTATTTYLILVNLVLLFCIFSPPSLGSRCRHPLGFRKNVGNGESEGVAVVEHEGNDWGEPCVQATLLQHGSKFCQTASSSNRTKLQTLLDY